MKLRKFLILITLALVVSILPITVSAEIGIPCAKGSAAMCKFNDVFVLINNGVKFFLQTILLPFMILLIAYSGFLFMTSGGNQERRSKAKKIFKNMFIGLALILGAWFIVYTIFTALGVDTTRGRAGLSDKTLNWNANTATAGSVVIAQNTTSQSGGAGSSTTHTEYAATIVVNSQKPDATRATVTITPKAPYKMAVRMSCLTDDGETRREGEGSIASGSTVTTIVLKLDEDTAYKCTLENMEGQIKLTDATDGEFRTPRISPETPDFAVVSSKFSTDFITINYKNASTLGSDAVFLYCKEKGKQNYLLSEMGAVIDRSKSNEVKVLNFAIPNGFLAGLKQNTEANCTFTAYTVDKITQKINPKIFAINGIFTAINTNNIIPTVFMASVGSTNTNTSVLVNFNGSINIDPNLTLECSSNGSNHIFRAKVSFDPTAFQRNQNPNGVITSPIVLPVAWNGYGLRPDSFYSCRLSGKTLTQVAEYPPQIVTNQSTIFNITTNPIPLIKNPESKLSYYVSLRSPRIVYTNYPILNSTNPNSNGPYLSPSNFKQFIPDAMFIPVTNGDVVDNSRMNLSCSGITGVAAGTNWVRTVSVSGEIGSINGMSKVYGDNGRGGTAGPGFSIPITQDPKSGFMHSSIYNCFAAFTVEKIPQIRSVVVGIPIYIDPTDIGPVVLAAENVSANSSFATFTIVASPRLQNSVNYSCRNVVGNYSGEAFWPPQALGIRMPIAIPVSSTIPGLKPGTKYNCELNGTTYQKQKVNFQFIITTP